MADSTTYGTSMMNLSFKASLPRLGRVLLDAKTECSAIVAVCAEAGVGAAPGAAAAGARADAASGSTDSLGMLLTTGTHEQKVDATPGCWCRAVSGMLCTCMTAGSGHVIAR